MPTRIQWFNILPCSFGVGDEVAEHRRATMKMTAIMTSFMILPPLLWTTERQRLHWCADHCAAQVRSMARCSWPGASKKDGLFLVAETRLRMHWRRGIKGSNCEIINQCNHFTFNSKVTWLFPWNPSWLLHFLLSLLPVLHMTDQCLPLSDLWLQVRRRAVSSKFYFFDQFTFGSSIS